MTKGRDRNEPLFNGRRVQIPDLIENGLLEAGAKIVFERPRVGTKHQASVTQDGRIELDNGTIFSSPSRAAVMAAGGGSFDGWHAWTLEATNTDLDTLRQKLLAKTIGDTAKTAYSRPLSSRHEYLTIARESADDGHPQTISVRELIDKWDARGRGQIISQQIAAELDNHGLLTVPDFSKVGLDSRVVLTLKSSIDREADEGNDKQSADTSGDLELDVQIGITLGNLQSANTAIVYVDPNALLEEAVTKMLLNGFSQLPVMTPGGRKKDVKGAVTWQSIARERHANPATRLRDAIIHVEIRRYDEELIDVLPALQLYDFILVEAADTSISGIITTADVVNEYGRLATPFFVIGELDQLLRQIVTQRFALSDVIGICGENGDRLKSFDDLTMGDYQRVFENPAKWAELAWPLDRRAFAERLKELREIRNDIMHFNPDPLQQGTVEKIRYMLRLLRQYG